MKKTSQKIKIFISIISLFLIVLIYMFVSNINDFEGRMVEKIRTDNEIGKVYKLNEFMTSATYNWFGGVDYIDIKDGFDIESKDGFEKFVFWKNDRVVKVIKTDIIGMGDLRRNQVFLDLESGSVGAYRCKPNSSIEVIYIDQDRLYFYIRPLDCLKIK